MGREEEEVCDRALVTRDSMLLVTVGARLLSFLSFLEQQAGNNQEVFAWR